MTTLFNPTSKNTNLSLVIRSCDLTSVINVNSSKCHINELRGQVTTLTQVMQGFVQCTISVHDRVRAFGFRLPDTLF